MPPRVERLIIRPGSGAGLPASRASRKASTRRLAPLKNSRSPEAIASSVATSAARARYGTGRAAVRAVTEGWVRG